MNDIVELKQKANELRKAKEFKEALPIYRSLWEETGDRFDGSGLLHCLRRLELFDEAIALADVLITKYPDFDWCRNEVVWTYIQGMLGKSSEQESLEKIKETANKIMSLNPEGLALRTVVFRVLKSAKSTGHWDTVNEWVGKISPDTLDINPSETDFNKGGWSDQALWYNYQLRGLLERREVDAEEIKKAIATANELSERFPKQRRFFLRLAALGNHILGNLGESEIVYQNLCVGPKPDWWLLHEYGKVVRDQGRNEDALKLLCRAAINHSKLPSMVTLFIDIGMSYKDMDDNQTARAHLVLSRCIREKQGWTLPKAMIDDISSLNQSIDDDKEPKSLEEALHICRAKWNELVSKDIYLNVSSRSKRTAKVGLIGKVSLGYSDRPFCFISTQDGQSFFCYKSDLPPNIVDGDEVTFDALPSFDKKKNKESWKASNVKQAT
jgi:tetratricopeptide (TPR) repeat protein